MTTPDNPDSLTLDFLDFPTAWAIQREVGETLPHHPKCSYIVAGSGYLCDCSAVPDEWERRRPSTPENTAEQATTNRPANAAPAVTNPTDQDSY